MPDQGETEDGGESCNDGTAVFLAYEFFIVVTASVCFAFSSFPGAVNRQRQKERKGVTNSRVASSVTVQSSRSRICSRTSEFQLAGFVSSHGVSVVNMAQTMGHAHEVSARQRNEEADDPELQTRLPLCSRSTERFRPPGAGTEIPREAAEDTPLMITLWKRVRKQ